MKNKQLTKYTELYCRIKLQTSITLANKFSLFHSFLRKFEILIIFKYLTTEHEMNFIILALSFAYYCVKDTYYEESLNKVKVETESQSHSFIQEINT